MTEWAERSAFERFLYVLEAPFRLARIVTIPTFIAPEELDASDVKAGKTMAEQPVLVNCPEKVAIAASALGFPCLITAWVQAEILDDDFETTVNGVLIDMYPQIIDLRALFCTVDIYVLLDGAVRSGIPLTGFVAVIATPFVGWLTILLWRSPDSCGFGFHAR
eukprot:COSAG02_NODE_26170_length_639_cov_0.901852_1_plen_162_part_01